MEPLQLVDANSAHTETLLPLVHAYHESEGIRMSDQTRKNALQPLLERTGESGHIWMVQFGADTIGYLALCFGYSIQFCGRDASIDEFYIAPDYRDKGIGGEVLELVKQRAAEYGVVALHLKVKQSNQGAKNLYNRCGFSAGDEYHLMSCRL